MFNLTAHIADTDCRVAQTGLITAGKWLASEPADAKLAARPALSLITREMLKAKAISERERESQRCIDAEIAKAAIMAELERIDLEDEIRTGLAALTQSPA